MYDKTPFILPRSSICVFQQVAAEYDLPSLPDLPAPRVIDIGANVGAFAWAALQRWPDATVDACEPHPETAALLLKNMVGLPVRVSDSAVVHPIRAVRLFEGKNANTEASLRDDVRWPHISQDLDTSYEVSAFDAADLPPCDVLKVDTEGSEVEILTGYRHLGGVRVLLVEVHAVGGDLKGQADLVLAIAKKHGLRVVDVRGTTIRFVREGETLPAAATPASSLPSDLPPGPWARVETIGGSWRFGRIVSRELASGEAILDPCFDCTPPRMIVAAPQPGQGFAPVPLDFDPPTFWGDGTAERVRFAAIQEISSDRAAKLYALARGSR